jgi:hypothetical protein
MSDQNAIGTGERAIVHNAADPRQVKRGAAKERDRVERLRAAIVLVLATPAGRLFVWELLERAGLWKSVMAPDGEIQYRSGRQDFGHEILALVMEHDEIGYARMEDEARTRKRRDNVETDAAHLARDNAEEERPLSES